MNEDAAFLRAMIAAPGDSTARLLYANWLDDQGDPRAKLLRSDWDVPRLSFVDWIAEHGNLDYYLDTYPKLRSLLNEHAGNSWWREKLKSLGPTIDPSWIALVDTLGRPFRPFFFWNNTGPQAFQNGELPFLEQIGTRGPVVTFESAFQGERAWQPGLQEDLHFLRQLELGECAYGSTSCPVHPFLCELEDPSRPLTGAVVLEALKAKDFRSTHIRTTNATTISAPGYQPATANDEVHNDPAGQSIFSRPEDYPDDADQKGITTHVALRAGVVDGNLWYVLLHSRDGSQDEEEEQDEEEYDEDEDWEADWDEGKGQWVVLFAVGRSPKGNRLIGVVTHQACHNFCD